MSNQEYDNLDDLQTIGSETNLWVKAITYLLIALMVVGLLALLIYGAYAIFGVIGAVVCGILIGMVISGAVYKLTKQSNGSIGDEMMADGLL